MNDVAGTINDPKIISFARAEVAAGRPVVVASLLATKGSMPRHEGARMLALSDGSFLGTSAAATLSSSRSAAQASSSPPRLLASLRPPRSSG